MMVRRRKANRAAIQDGPAIVALGELAVAFNSGLSPTGVDAWEERLVALVAAIGTLTGHPMNVSKIAHETGLSRATARRRLRALVDKGALLAMSDGSYEIAAAYLNAPEVRARTALMRRAVLKAARALEAAEVAKLDTKPLDEA